MWTAHECQVIIPYYVSPFPQIFPLSFSIFTHLPSSLSLFQAPPRVFFKTGVIDIETLIRCRHLWLTATMTGGEEGEKKGEGLGFSIKRHKTIFEHKHGQVYSRTAAVSNRRGVIFVFEKEVILPVMQNICWDPQGDKWQTVAARKNSRFFYIVEYFVDLQVFHMRLRVFFLLWSQRNHQHWPHVVTSVPGLHCSCPFLSAFTLLGTRSKLWN